MLKKKKTSVLRSHFISLFAPLLRSQAGWAYHGKEPRKGQCHREEGSTYASELCLCYSPSGDRDHFEHWDTGGDPVLPLPCSQMTHEQQYRPASGSKQTEKRQVMLPRRGSRGVQTRPAVISGKACQELFSKPQGAHVFSRPSVGPGLQGAGG